MTSTYDLKLLPQHNLLLAESAIDAEVARERGYRSVRTGSELDGLGFSQAQKHTPGLLIPVWNVHGKVALHQLRPDEPRKKKDKPVKYETPTGARMVVDVPPRVRDQLGDPSIPLYITEGIRKADSGASHGLCIIDLLGVWNWRGKNASGGKTALADWELIALNDRKVFIVYDSDVTTKSSVQKAILRLARFLQSRGGRVEVLLLPEGKDAT